MAKKLSDFESALLEAALDEFINVPAESEIDIQPSPEFEEKAEDLIRKTKRTGWYYVNTALKRAILIAAIIGALATTAFAVPAIREAIIDFFFTDEGNHYGITFDPEEASKAPKLIEKVYGPTFIPDGYHLEMEDASFGGAALWWVNSEDQWICYYQNTIPDDPTYSDWIGIDSEEIEMHSITIGDYLVVRHQEKSNNYYTLYWTDNAYFYHMELDNSISEDEMTKIFLSICAMPQYDDWLIE